MPKKKSVGFLGISLILIFSYSKLSLAGVMDKITSGTAGRILKRSAPSLVSRVRGLNSVKPSQAFYRNQVKTPIKPIPVYLIEKPAEIKSGKGTRARDGSSGFCSQLAYAGLNAVVYIAVSQLYDYLHDSHQEETKNKQSEIQDQVDPRANPPRKEIDPTKNKATGSSVRRA